MRGGDIPGYVWVILMKYCGVMRRRGANPCLKFVWTNFGWPWRTANRVIWALRGMCSLGGTIATMISTFVNGWIRGGDDAWQAKFLGYCVWNGDPRHSHHRPIIVT